MTAVVLQPAAFLQRLAVLTPSPYAHLVRYHGVFANRAAGAAITEGLGDLNNLLKTRPDLAPAAQPILKKLQDGLDKLK